jgi:hypothetical protein
VANHCANGVKILVCFQTRRKIILFLFFNDLLHILIKKPHRWHILMPYAQNFHCPSFHINLYSNLSPTRQSDKGKLKSPHIYGAKLEQDGHE